MNKKKTWSIVGLIVIALIVVIAIWPKDQKNKQVTSKGTTITIGSKNFSESKIIMQIWADALKKDGYKVKTKPNISSSVVYQAIKWSS